MSTQMRSLWSHRSRQRQSMLAPRMTKRIDLSLPDCRCSVPPWEWCPHVWEPVELDPEQLDHLRSIRYDDR
jgi:hypothetical protein